MNISTKILDKVLTSVVTSAVLFFVGFSFMTGKFPPQKADMKRAFHLMKEMFVTTQAANEANRSLQENAAPTLEQIVEMQKLGLKRSETALELTKLMARFPKGVPSASIAEKLQQAQLSMQNADQMIAQVHAEIQKLAEAPAEVGP